MGTHTGPTSHWVECNGNIVPRGHSIGRWQQMKKGMVRGTKSLGGWDEKSRLGVA